MTVKEYKKNKKHYIDFLYNSTLKTIKSRNQFLKNKTVNNAMGYRFNKSMLIQARKHLGIK